MRRITLGLVAASVFGALPAIAQSAFPDIKNLGDVSITLIRAGGMGESPTYQLVIDQGGRVSYEGKANVFVRGKRRSRISVGAMKGLIEEFRHASFFGLEDSYTFAGTDQPACVITFQALQSSKRIVDYGGEMYSVAPESLVYLEKGIDYVINVKKWTKGSLIRRLLHWK